MFQYFTPVDYFVFAIMATILTIVIFKFWLDKDLQKGLLIIVTGKTDIIRYKRVKQVPTIYSSLTTSEDQTVIVWIANWLILWSYLFSCVMAVILLP